MLVKNLNPCLTLVLTSSYKDKREVEPGKGNLVPDAYPWFGLSDTCDGMGENGERWEKVQVVFENHHSA